MLEFWITASVLVLLAIVLVLLQVKFTFAKLPATVDQTEANVTIYKQRLGLLLQSFADKQLSHDQFKLEKDKLQYALLGDVKDIGKISHQPQLPKSALLLLLLMPLIVMPLYQHWGSSQQLAETYRQQRMRPQLEKLLAELKTPEQVIARLQQRLQQQPNSAKGWYLLGRLYYVNQNFAAAKQALAHSYRLDPLDSNVATHYAQALFLADDKQLSQHAHQVIDQVLARQANNPVLINLLALDAFQHKHYQQAIAAWRKLLALLPADSATRTEVESAIGKAQQALSVSH